MYTLVFASLHCSRLCTAATTYIVTLYTVCYIGLCLNKLPPFYTATITYIVRLYTVCMHWIMPHYTAILFIRVSQETLLQYTWCDTFD